MKEIPTSEDALSFFKLLYIEDITMEDINTKYKRSARWTEAKRKLHPDKHVANQDLANTVFQKLESFQKKCENLEFLEESSFSQFGRKKMRKELERTNNSSQPVTLNLFRRPMFAVHDQSIFCNGNHSGALCYNMRGQMWHFGATGRVIGLFYKPDIIHGFKSLTYPGTTVNVETIKTEISERGPVLSRSYLPHAGVCEQGDHPVIIGWEVQDVQGEVWIVRVPNRGNKNIHVAFGTCNIEHDLAIPVANLSDTQWQPGAYLALPGEWKVWKKWPSFELTLTMAEFTTLWRSLGVKSALELCTKKPQFEAFRSGKRSYSRRSYISDFQLLDDSKIKVIAYFCPQLCR